MRQLTQARRAVICTLVGAFGASVHAQEQALDDVVVSASRTEQRSFDAPASVQAVDRDTIQNAGAQVNLSESLARVPGLTILDRENYAQDLQLSIRGFGARATFGINGIRLLIDGIPASTPDGQGQASSISLTSMDHIEVLRGPLAQLYGNASGGVIQAFTKPAPAQPQVDYQYYTGSYGLRHSDYQFGDTAGMYGIVADYSAFTLDGYRANSAAERNQFNGKVDFSPNDQTHVHVVVNQFNSPYALDALGLTSRQLAADPSQAGTGATQYATRKTVLQNQIGSSATYCIDADRSVTARAYFGTRDNLQYQAATVPASGVFPADGSWVGLARHYYGVGLQYNAHTLLDALPVDWVVGYDFDRSREFRQGGPTSQGEIVGGLTRDEDDQSEDSDFFIQGRAPLGDAFALTGGMRYSTVRFLSQSYYTANGINGSGSDAYYAVSPVLGVTYFATDHLNLYANFGRGFETPTLAEMAYEVGPSAAHPVVQLFDPNLSASTSQHYETGLKWVPTAQSRLDFALYQVYTFNEIVVAASSAGQTAYVNAPTTSRNGFELSGSTRLTPHLSVTASASMIDAVYSEGYKSGTTTVAAGNRIPGIPATSLFSELAWTSADVPAYKGAPAMGARLAGELVQSGRIYADDSNLDSVDGHTVLNLAASQRWGLGKGALTLFARVNNVTNERYVGSVIVDQASSQFYEPALPTNWSLGVAVSAPL